MSEILPRWPTCSVYGLWYVLRKYIWNDACACLQLINTKNLSQSERAVLENIHIKIYILLCTFLCFFPDSVCISQCSSVCWFSRCQCYCFICILSKELNEREHYISKYMQTERLKRNKVIGGWTRLHNEELHNLYSSPCIIRMIKSRRMRWVGHVAWMGRRKFI
jgi:hypothetical protein